VPTLIHELDIWTKSKPAPKANEKQYTHIVQRFLEYLQLTIDSSLKCDSQSPQTTAKLTRTERPY